MSSHIIKNEIWMYRGNKIDSWEGKWCLSFLVPQLVLVWEIGYHWFRRWLVNLSSRNHYLNQWWHSFCIERYSINNLSNVNVFVQEASHDVTGTSITWANIDRDTWRHMASPGPWFNVKIPSYLCRKSHCGDKTVVSPQWDFLYW